jgi:small subunit ribosomal protein S16
MLMIRLQRLGRKKSPSYRFIVNEKAQDTQGKSLEILGQYNPTTTPKTFQVQTDRVEYWMSKGAQLSNTVHNLFLKEGIVKGDKKKSVSITDRRQTKIDKKKVEVEASKAKKAEEAAKAKEAAEATKS